ncbi:hypothetical protein HK413_14170 [Mucilaginibacter sp. S1162]|uniref:Uncharacterized protein n=1 Tax=Mucilaginibacter humi TaxID=2732510 RepID=A0ABX1W7J1_9SPHI|nr:hypothetical protein [Mucilaginibacter humi]NNU34905.1 hypothetical protein [Mucilaginibacter humi]
MKITTHTGESAEALQKQAANSAQIYQLTNLFLQRAFKGLKELFTKEGFKAFLNVKRAIPGAPCIRLTKSIFKDERMVQFYDGYATYNGSNPYAAPATLNIIPHLERSLARISLSRVCTALLPAWLIWQRCLA